MFVEPDGMTVGADVVTEASVVDLRKGESRKVVGVNDP